MQAFLCKKEHPLMVFEVAPVILKDLDYYLLTCLIKLHSEYTGLPQASK